MQSTVDQIETIVTKAGELIETKSELLKLKAVDKISDAVSSVITVIAIVLLAGVSFIIISFGIAYWIGKELGNIHYGFFIVGGFYVIAGLILFFARVRLIKAPLRDIIIDKIIK
ncbi:MAG: phage holin family protein [Chitinophagaceae bacterium]|nr:phage holin family protein [Chitinophagaceae bacterium]